MSVSPPPVRPPARTCSSGALTAVTAPRSDVPRAERDAVLARTSAPVPLERRGRRGAQRTPCDACGFPTCARRQSRGRVGLQSASVDTPSYIPLGATQLLTNTLQRAYQACSSLLRAHVRLTQLRSGSLRISSAAPQRCSRIPSVSAAPSLRRRCASASAAARFLASVTRCLPRFRRHCRRPSPTEP
jgi:hypothetical protein